MIRFKGDFSYRLPLLFKGNIDWYFVGKSHEYMTAKQDYTNALFDSLIIDHLYDNNIDAKTKLERNLNLLLEDNESPRRSFYLGETYRQLGDYKKAIYYYQDRIDAGGWNQEIFYSLWQIGLMNDDPKQLWEAWKLCPERAEPLYSLMRYYRTNSQPEISVQIGYRAIETLQPEGLFVHGDIYAWGIPFEYSICLAQTGFYDLAEQYNQKTLAENPPNHISD